MLILSRRQNERVNFPALGITVEVLRTGQKKVQLGIDAPPEIRVVRDELDWDANQTDSISLNQSRELAVREELRNVSTAIRLSQNLLNQGRHDIANQALDDAIEALSRLESQFFADDTDKFAETTTSEIRESGAPYRIARTKTTTLNQLLNDWVLELSMP